MKNVCFLSYLEHRTKTGEKKEEEDFEKKQRPTSESSKTLPFSFELPPNPSPTQFEAPPSVTRQQAKTNNSMPK